MSKTTGKFIALVSCLAVLGALFAGCGGQGPAAPESTSPAETGQAQSDGTAGSAPAEKVTLTLLIDNQSALEGINAVAAAVEEKLNVAISIDLRPGGTEGDNVVKTRLATGDMDDLCFYNSGSLFKALNPGQHFADLTDEPLADNILDSFKPCVSVDGRLYGVPAGTTTGGGWLYNKSVYADLGLSVPKTWSELLENCEKIKAAGKTAVIGSYKDTWTSQLILLADYYNVQAQAPTFADDFTANKAKFATTPAALRSFEKLQEIFENGYMNKDFLATTYETAQKMLVEGTGAHYPMLTFVLANMKANYPEQVNDIGFFAQPGDSADMNGATIWMPGGLYVNKDSEKLEAAIQWVSYFVSPEGVADYMSAQKPDGPFAIKNVSLPDDVLPAVKDMLPYFEAGNTAPALEFLSPVKGPNLEMITVEAGSGLKTPLECAQEYDKDVEKQAKQLGLEGW